MPAAVNQSAIVEESSYFSGGPAEFPRSFFYNCAADRHLPEESPPNSVGSNFEFLGYDIFGPRSWTNSPSQQRKQAVFSKHPNDASPPPAPPLTSQTASYMENGGRFLASATAGWSSSGSGRFPTLPLNEESCYNSPPSFSSFVRNSPPYSSSDSSVGSSTWDMPNPNSPDRDTFDIHEQFAIFALKENNDCGGNNYYSTATGQQYTTQARHQIGLTGRNGGDATPNNHFAAAVTTNARNGRSCGLTYRSSGGGGWYREEGASSLETMARNHRKAAVTDNNTTGNTWRGDLPARVFRKDAIYSCKVFVGGVPWDMTEETLVAVFKEFGLVKIEWPTVGKEGGAAPPKGYVYLIFESEKSVKELLKRCSHDFGSGGNWYYRIPRRLRKKEVQVIPWVVSDSVHVVTSGPKLDPTLTVFVGALHGMINAQFLFKVMDDLFGGVIFAGIDTDKNKYPIGSGRVTFNNPRSYMNAVSSKFAFIKTSKFTKKVQIDPYLEESPCCICNVQQGPYFCRDVSCFKYYCRSCWIVRHYQLLDSQTHKPITRTKHRT